ncbi:NAD(P)/FAD-dependent oxidoreductase [candidate division WOR-3 bacterium]|nr:NAD(P)/FAD-dependent oxidoreductase [candidate division WOR-3 bacterium]
MEEIDITIIGAGVIGLAIASELAKESRAVYVLERYNTFGQETSSRNSEVIHAGIYYTHNTLKAKTCVEGNNLLYELCEKNKIPYKKTGKLIVATNGNEVIKLEELKKRGDENGARDLKLLSQSEVMKLEPNIQAKGALFSPTTGVLDSHSLMKYCISKTKENGGEVVYNSNVVGLDKKVNGYKVTISEGNGDYFSFMSKIVINSAGLGSDKIAEMVGIDIKKQDYELKFCKGDYFSVGHGKSHLLEHLIYPVPNGDTCPPSVRPALTRRRGRQVGLGIHVTLDIGGRLKLGPDDYYISRMSECASGTDKGNLDYSVDESKKKEFYESVKDFLPFIEKDDLSPDMSGIRPKLQGQHEDFKDFVIKDEEDIGFPGFINLIGIESPGLTSSISIAKLVKNLAEKYIN